MSNADGSSSHRFPSSSGAIPLVLDPITDETRAKDYAEIAIFAVDQIEQSGPVQLLQAREI